MWGSGSDQRRDRGTGRSMSAIETAAVLLAIAALLGPAPPVGRLLPARGGPGLPKARWAGAAAVAVLAVPVAQAPASLLLPGILTGVLVAGRLRRQRRSRRRRREGQAMAAALEVLVGELRVGAHPLAAFTSTAAESTGATAAALRAVSSRALLGADVGEGMRVAARTSPVPEQWHRLAVFWDLAAQHGLALCPLMRAAHRDIVERQRFADRMRAALAGARATAAILAALPALGVLLGQLIGADPIRFLLGGGLGGALLAVGVGLICVGITWADHIVERLIT